MARSLIYFYPTSDVPITMKNVVAAVKACHAPPPDLPRLLQLTGEAAAERDKRFKPTAFLSVPYILSTLAEDLDGEGINMLQGMEFVSTGGAPLDTLIGDAMVQRRIRLVSRLGSSECGCKSTLCCDVISPAPNIPSVLLSSHRDYETEKDWELLRNDSPYADALRFEETDAGPSGTRRYEMVVTSNWTSLVGISPTGRYHDTDPTDEKQPRRRILRFWGSIRKTPNEGGGVAICRKRRRCHRNGTSSWLFFNPADISPMVRRRLLVLWSQSFEHRPSLQMLLLSDLNDLSLDSCSSPVAIRLSNLYYLLSHLSSTKPIEALHRSRTYLPTCVW